MWMRRGLLLHMLDILTCIMARRGTSLSSSLYRRVESIDSHIDNVTRSLALAAFSKYTPPQARVAKRMMALFVGVLLVAYTCSPLLLKANTVLFYPTACLGGWVTPYHASGAPHESSEYSAATSAVLPANTHAELYCGSFDGVVPEGTTPKDTRLVMYWNVEQAETEENIFEDQPVEIVAPDFSESIQTILDAEGSDVSFTATTSAVSEEESNSSSPDVSPPGEGSQKDSQQEESSTTPGAGDIPSETTPEPAQPVEQSTEIQQEAPVSSRIGASILALIVSPVYAQEEVVIESPQPSVSAQEVVTSTQEEAPAETATPESVKETTPIQTEDTKVDTPKENEPQAILEQEVLEEGIPIHPSVIEAERKEAERKEAIVPPIVEVLYTFDGVTWKSLAKLAAKDINQQPFILPYEVGTTWKNLKSLQIKVQSLQTFDEAPTIYVDAVELQIDYKKKYDTRVDSSEDAVAIDVDDTTGQKILTYGDEKVEIIKGITPYLAIVGIRNTSQELQDKGLWLYDIENNKRLRVATSTQIDDISRLGVKDDYVFWVSDGGLRVHAFDTRHRTYQTRIVEPFDISSGERGEVSFDDVPWKIILGADRFYFWSKETGEVFSDENSLALDNFRKEFRLDDVLSDEEKDAVGIPIESDAGVVN